MPGINIGRFGHLDFVGTYKPGDQPPTGYNDWHAWADVQHKAGLRQAQCPHCSLWKYPQELSETVAEWTCEDKRGRKRKFRGRVCKVCDGKASA